MGKICVYSIKKLQYVSNFQLLVILEGGGYYVFPGASHNRFEHSIG